MRFYIFLWITSILLLSTLFDHKTVTSAKTARSAKSYVNLKVRTGGLQVDDVFVIRGTFKRKGFLQIRFMSPPTACSGGRRPPNNTPTCQPLVIKIFPKRGLLKVSYVGKKGTMKDVPIVNKTSRYIQPKKKFHIKIIVGERNYTIIFNKTEMLTVRDEIGRSQIRRIRAYGGTLFRCSLFRPKKKTTSKNRTCGKRPAFANHNFRIIGGSRAKRGEVPWQAALRFKKKHKNADFFHVCGAALIDSCWVITAAHCVIIASLFPHKHVVRVGDYYNEEEDRFSAFEDSQDLEIAEVIRHPGYHLTKNGEAQNDVALIRLRSNSNSSTCARFGDLVQPICLPSPGDDFPTSSTCTISGWGATARNQIFPSQYSRFLLAGNITIRDHKKCKRLHGKDGTGKDLVADHTVCASNPGVDTCRGDSGGPLSCSREGGPFVLWGLTSWGECNHPTIPGVYMKISSFVPWIKETMRA